MLTPSRKIERPIAERRHLISSVIQDIHDEELIQLVKGVPWTDWVTSPEGLPGRHQFLKTFNHWITSSKLNSIQGLDRFAHQDIIAGTAQTFHEAYIKHNKRTLRLFRGENPYHRRVDVKWAFLEDRPLGGGDYVVISAPFYSTGQIHPEFHNILSTAEKMNVPVIIDCENFGTCEGLELDLNHSAIESVSFSLSKALGLNNIPSGIRYSNIEHLSPIHHQNKHDPHIPIAAKLGLYMMEQINPDFIPTKYSKIQKDLCAELNIEATPCMHLALGNSADWNSYTIDNTYRRIGLAPLLTARLNGNI